MMKRKDEVVKGLVGGVGYLFKKHKIEHLKGSGRILSPGSVEVSAPGSAPVIHKTQRILIATGSAPIQLPALPFDEKYIVSSTGGLSFSEVPKKLLVVGAGYIGVELGSVWNRVGSGVIVLGFLDRAVRGMEKEMGGEL